jgi:hypothetical protein
MRKIKISKTSWLILFAGVFVVIVVGLFLTHSQQLKEQERLNDELSVVEMRLNKLEVKQLYQEEEGLQKQVDENNVQLLAAKDSLRQTVESIDVTDKFFAIARSCDVEITSISSSSIKTEDLGDINCFKITLNVVAEGEVDNLISFIIKLNNDFITGIVDSAQISIPEKDCQKPSANIMVAVHAYKGD